MAYWFALASVPWDWVSIGGGLGGALNAAIASDLRPFPSWSRAVTRSGIRQVTRVGLLVSSGVGAVASVGLLWALQGMADSDELPAGQFPLRLVVSSLCVGFLTARGLTSEIDKALLRLAVRSAAAAPAAHPKVAQAIDHAPPYAVYEIAAELAPRRRMSPPGRLHVSTGFEKAHPQRL